MYIQFYNDCTYPTENYGIVVKVYEGLPKNNFRYIINYQPTKLRWCNLRRSVVNCFTIACKYLNNRRVNLIFL